MEVELKYAIADEAIADRIWEDEWLSAMAEPKTRSCERFHGAYYDTDDRLLLQNHIAFRVRQEGKFIVAALKWDGDNEGALHKREELNVTIGQMPDEGPEDHAHRLPRGAGAREILPLRGRYQGVRAVPEQGQLRPVR